MSAALRAVRSALGSDALILETKNHPEDLGGGVEITTLAEEPASEKLRPGEPATAVRPQQHPLDEVRQELAALKSMLSWLAPGLNHQDKIVKALVAHGLAPEIVAQLCDAVKRSAAGGDREQWFRAIAGWVSSGGQVASQHDRLALIGPAGVGKTTTLIKLTIFETQRRDCRVGWINADERGLAAGDPLAIYAGILGVRYEKAANKKELKQALGRLADCDLVLVDTPGVNPRDEEKIQGMAKDFRDLSGLRRALLLNAATHERDMTEWVASCRRIGLHALLFTKLDECRYLGPLLNTAWSSGLPVAYLTLGQNLAGDLEVARPEVFASLLLTGVD